MTTSVPETLHVGSARVDITPPLGTQIAGDIGRRRPAEMVLDPLYAKALILQHADERICLLVMDLLAMNTAWCDRLRTGLSARYGLPKDRIVIHITQTHAAPSLGHCFCRDEWPQFQRSALAAGADDAYNLIVEKAVMEVVGQALKTLQPVRIGMGRAIESRVAFNRRFVMRDGTGRCHPSPGDPAIAYCEGPMDPELSLLVFQTLSMTPAALLMHHTSHPCHGYPERWISADWPGSWSDGVQSSFGRGALPMVINGCCGNIHHCNHLDPSREDTIESMGRILTQTSAQVFKRIELSDGVPLALRRTVVKIPLRAIDPAYLAWAQKYMADHPTPVWRKNVPDAVEWDWVYASCTLDLADSQKKQNWFDYEIQAVRIGNAALVALMGEPFVEGQLDLKVRSPATYTFVAHMCNGYVAMCPPYRRWQWRI